MNRDEAFEAILKTRDFDRDMWGEANFFDKLKQFHEAATEAERARSRVLVETLNVIATEQYGRPTEMIVAARLALKQYNGTMGGGECERKETRDEFEARMAKKGIDIHGGY